MANVIGQAIAIYALDDGGFILELNPRLIAPKCEDIPEIGMMLSRLIDRIAEVYADDDPDCTVETWRHDITKMIASDYKPESPSEAGNSKLRDHLKLVSSRPPGEHNG